MVFNFTYPDDYPSKNPPIFTLTCRWLELSQVNTMINNKTLILKTF